MNKASRAKWIPFVLLALVLAGCPSVLDSTITITPGVPSDGSSIVSGVWYPNSSSATLQLTAVVSPSNASKKSVTWSATYVSGQTGQVSVTADGLVEISSSISGVMVETITATATDGSGVTATFTVNGSNFS